MYSQLDELVISIFRAIRADVGRSIPSMHVWQLSTSFIGISNFSAGTKGKGAKVLGRETCSANRGFPEIAPWVRNSWSRHRLKMFPLPILFNNIYSKWTALLEKSKMLVIKTYPLTLDCPCPKLYLQRTFGGSFSATSIAAIKYSLRISDWRAPHAKHSSRTFVRDSRMRKRERERESSEKRRRQHKQWLTSEISKIQPGGSLSR